MAEFIAAWLPFAIVLIAFGGLGAHQMRRYRRHVNEVKAINDELVAINREMIAELREIKAILKDRT